MKNVKSHDEKGQSIPLVVPAALSSLSLNEEALTPIEPTDSRNMSDDQLDKSPSEIASEASGGALGVAATFCCGAPDISTQVNTNEVQSSSVGSQTAGIYKRVMLNTVMRVFQRTNTCSLLKSPVPGRSSAKSQKCVMFVRLRVQSNAGRKKRAGGFQFGTAARREAWIALSQERYADS